MLTSPCMNILIHDIYKSDWTRKALNRHMTVQFSMEVGIRTVN
jgi:hypothetical protein